LICLSAAPATYVVDRCEADDRRLQTLGRFLTQYLVMALLFAAMILPAPILPAHILAAPMMSAAQSHVAADRMAGADCPMHGARQTVAQQTGAQQTGAQQTGAGKAHPHHTGAVPDCCVASACAASLALPFAGAATPVPFLASRLGFALPTLPQPAGITSPPSTDPPEARA
jgi:hypothetical protein